MLGFNAIGMDAVGTSGSQTVSQSASTSGASMSGAGTFTGGTATGGSSGTPSSAPGASMSGTGTFSGGMASNGAQPATITVPASRTAIFVARPRVAVFAGTAPVGMAKGAQDQLYVVADMTKDLTDGATAIASGATPVTLIVAGVTVLEGPSVQGNLIVVKLGALDMSNRAVNSVIFRVTCANGEVFDRTLILTAFDDRSQVFGKDPDDKRFFSFDVSADLALSSGATIASVQTPVAVGVSALSTPVIQGGQVVLLLGGLDLSNNAVNSCGLVMTLATSEVIYRTIYFSRQDH